MAHRIARPVTAAAVLACLLAPACSSSKVTRNNPVDEIQPPIVTLTAAGAAPTQLHLFTQEGITFVNQDARAHEIVFDAAKSDKPGCSAIAVGRIEAGQQRTTPLLPGFALCYYAAADAPADPRWQGVVVTH